MSRNVEYYENPVIPYIFRKSVPAGESGVMKMELTGHGYVTQVSIIFAAGENATLRLRPYVEHPGELTNQLLKYAGDEYISGDSCDYKLPCYQEVENHSILKLYYENTAEAGTADSQIMVDMIVQYDSYVEPRNVIG